MGRVRRRQSQRGAWRWPSRWAWAQALLALAVAALSVLAWSERSRFSPLERLDGLLLDAQTQWRGPLMPGSEHPIALLRFDEASAVRLGGMVPSREQLAQILDQVQKAQPRAIALDQLLLDARPEADERLARSLRGGAPVLLPFALPPLEGVDRKAASPVPTRLLAQAYMRTQGMPRTALQPSRADIPPEPLLSAAAALGHVTVLRGHDGTLRQDLPALELGGEAYPTLALRLAGQALGQDWAGAQLNWGQSIQWGALSVPLDLWSRQWVNYYGPTGRFPSASVAELLDQRVAPEWLRGRIVILGVSALGAGDHFPSPFDAGLPGMERLATVTDNLLTHRSLQRPGWAVPLELGLMLALPLLACTVLGRWPLRRALGLLLVLLVGGLAAAQWSFEHHFTVLALAWPLLALGLATLGALMLRALADQSRRREALAALRASEQRYALAAQGANDGLWDWDVAADTAYFSPRWLSLMGLGAEQARQASGMAAFTLPLDEAAARDFRAELQAHLDGRSLQFHQVLRFQQGGQARSLLARGVAVRADAGGKALRMAGSLTDISETERLQHQLSHDALHDRLTGLPNRTLFVELLNQRLSAITNPVNPANPAHVAPLGVLLLGLDEFRNLNETHGVLAGDAVLAECARRLSQRAGQPVARLGADQFGILFDARLITGALVDRVPEWALAKLEQPFIGMASPGQILQVSASAGWAHAGQGLGTADELLAAAESALARAKSQGTGRVHAFDPAEQLLEQSRRWVRDNIARALENGEFQLHYQPFIRLSDRALLGFEALIRWKHPTKGMVMPGDFIPVAEESGQIVDIGRWTLMEAAAQLRRWRDVGFRGEIAVNVSGVQLERDVELLADARELLRQLGDVPPSQLKLEVTESMAMANPQRSAETLQELARMGFKLSIDDFGTGYSSLAYLHRFPFDTLKVDRSFVMRLAAGREAQEIVRTIVGLALSLGKQTLAEGVEDEQQAQLLEALGVQVGQGWLFAKAMPEADAKKVIQEPPWRKPAG